MIKIDHVFRERQVRNSDIPNMYPKAKISKKLQERIDRQPEERIKILEVVCKDYSIKNEDAYLFYAIECNTKEIIREEKYQGVGSNPFICFRWSKCSGETYGRGPLINALSAQSKPPISPLNLSLRTHRWLSQGSIKWKMMG